MLKLIHNGKRKRIGGTWAGKHHLRTMHSNCSRCLRFFFHKLTKTVAIEISRFETKRTSKSSSRTRIGIRVRLRTTTTVTERARSSKSLEDQCLFVWWRKTKKFLIVKRYNTVSMFAKKSLTPFSSSLSIAGTVLVSMLSELETKEHLLIQSIDKQFWWITTFQSLIKLIEELIKMSALYS